MMTARRSDRVAWRRSGWFLAVAGTGLLVGLLVFANVRFPLTNYNSRIDVNAPVVYYTHALDAGDTLYFSIDLDGDPVDILILDPASFLSFQEDGASPDPPARLHLRDTVGRVEVRFTAPVSGRYYVVFASACSVDCQPTSIQARLWVTAGQVAEIPVPLLAAGSGAVAVLGVAMLAVRRRSSRS